MRAKQQRPVISRISELEEVAPPISAIEALRRNMLHTMFKTVTSDDMEEMIRVQVEHAKGGDKKSFKMLTDMFMAGQTTVPVQMNQAVVVNQFEQQHKSLSETRRMLVCLISQTGPQETLDIAKQLHSPLDYTLQALDYPWFQKETDGWHVTNDARAQVLPNGIQDNE